MLLLAAAVPVTLAIVVMKLVQGASTARRAEAHVRRDRMACEDLSKAAARRDCRRDLGNPAGAY